MARFRFYRRAACTISHSIGGELAMHQPNLGDVSRSSEVVRPTARDANFSVGVIVVTFNRRDLLEQTLRCLEAQSYPLEKIIVVDNCSTDSTRDFLRTKKTPKLEALLLEKNTGGAGGFAAGIERACHLGFDLIWVMDDDVLPASDALERLIAGFVQLQESGVQPNFVTANVFGA